MAETNMAKNDTRQTNHIHYWSNDFEDPMYEDSICDKGMITKNKVSSFNIYIYWRGDVLSVENVKETYKVCLRLHLLWLK